MTTKRLWSRARTATAGSCYIRGNKNKVLKEFGRDLGGIAAEGETGGCCRLLDGNPRIRRRIKMRCKANECRQDGSKAKRHTAHDFALLSSYLHAQPKHFDYTFTEAARDILGGQNFDLGDFIDFIDSGPGCALAPAICTMSEWNFPSC